MHSRYNDFRQHIHKSFLRTLLCAEEPRGIVILLVQNKVNANYLPFKQFGQTQSSDTVDKKSLLSFDKETELHQHPVIPPQVNSAPQMAHTFVLLMN
jgi:hypothetical protein